MRAGANTCNALHRAVKAGDEHTVSELLLRGASPHARDTNGYPPLYHACENDYTEIMRLLLLNGACTNDRPPSKSERVPSTSEIAPLHVVVQNGSLGATKLLLAAGADSNAVHHTNGGLGAAMSALDYSTEMERLDIMRTLIEHGANPNGACKDGFDAIQIATSRAASGAVAVLCNAGAHVNVPHTNWETPLFDTAHNADVDSMLILLKHGADVNVRNRCGDSPLHAVAWDVTQWMTVPMIDLLRWGADETATENGGRTAAEFATAVFGEQEDIFLQEREAERVVTLLNRAPLDRAWRRRGFLVMCRAFPDRVRLPAASGGERARDSVLGHCDGVLARLVGLEEEVFRLIASFL